MIQMKMSPSIRILLLGLICISGIGFAQTTGKIAGKVIDKNSGEPLPAVNIIIQGTSMGAASRMDGDFFILNVPPGTYDVKASMLGYGPMIIQSVRVSVNSTTTLNFQLTNEDIQGEAVTVTAAGMATKKDQTSSIRTVSTEELEALPVENLTQVINTQAGVVRGHFRGGRDTEVTYLLDGINIDNVFAGDSKSTEIDVEIINELEVITGTFNAEYGNAMSGVVNAVTKEGADKFGGSFSSSLANYFTRNNDIFIGLNEDGFLTRNLSQDYKLQLEGPILSKKLSYIMNYRYQDNNGYLNGIRRFNPIDFSTYPDKMDPATWHTENTGDGDYISMVKSKFHNAFGKLTYRASNSLKISALATYNDNTLTGYTNSAGYNHDWKYNPNPAKTFINKSYMGALTVNHVISQNIFWDLKLSYNQQKLEDYFREDPLHEDYISPIYRGQHQTGFRTGGVPDPGKNMDTFANANAKYDLYWQINPQHGVKTGVSTTFYDVERDRIDVRNTYEGTAIEWEASIDTVTGKIDFPNYVLQLIPKSDRTLDVYNVKPREFAAYIQDKMEFDDLVFNVGVRFDYFSPQQVYPSDLRNPGNQLIFADSLNRMSTYPDAPAKKHFSPRFGIAYQLGDEAVLRFSYGHFVQMPPMYALYKNNVFRVPTSDYAITMGNTLLDPQKTVTYELGLWRKLTDAMSLELALYYKDIYDLLSTRIVTTYNQIQYGLYTNKDYGNARGLEVKWKFQMGGVFANLNYTLGYTKGNADDPEQTFTRAGDSQDPIKRYIPMPWDQRHTLNLTTGYASNTYGFTLLAYYNSGNPYTYTPLEFNRLADLNLYTNNDYQSSTFTVDLTSFWRLPILNDFDVRLVLNVYNLLDGLNDQEVYGYTGKAYNTIVTETEKNIYASDFTDVYDQFQDPSMYSAPRQIKLGLAIKF